LHTLNIITTKWIQQMEEEKGRTLSHKIYPIPWWSPQVQYFYVSHNAFLSFFIFWSSFHSFLIQLNLHVCYFFFLILISLTNDDKSSPTEAFPYPNTTPLSHIRYCGNNFFILYTFHPTNLLLHSLLSNYFSFHSQIWIHWLH